MGIIKGTCWKHLRFPLSLFAQEYQQIQAGKKSGNLLGVNMDAHSSGPGMGKWEPKAFSGLSGHRILTWTWNDAPQNPSFLFSCFPAPLQFPVCRMQQNPQRRSIQSWNKAQSSLRTAQIRGAVTREYPDVINPVTTCAYFPWRHILDASFHRI